MITLEIGTINTIVAIVIGIGTILAAVWVIVKYFSRFVTHEACRFHGAEVKQQINGLSEKLDKNTDELKELGGYIRAKFDQRRHGD
jgi:hypothetical protein